MPTNTEAPGILASLIWVVDREIGQRMQPEKRHTGVEEPVQTIGGQ
jgi:hypothetical protein